jgi:hypothetical protein
MLLSPEDARLAFKLHSALMQFVNQELKIVSADGSAAAYMELPAEARHRVARAFVRRLDLIGAFLAANPAHLSPEELAIVSTWRHLVAGRFIAMRQVKEHMLLLSCDGASTAFGVKGLIDPLPRVIGRSLPAMIEAVLLPFRGTITYDGIVSGFNVTFGPGSRRVFDEQLRAAQAGHRVVTSLPATVANELSNEVPKPKRVSVPRPRSPSAGQLLAQVVGLTDAFCQAHLNEEYAALCRKLAQKLAAKRPSPLFRGKLETWAGGIVRTIGWVNFLDDRSQSPHLKLPVIDRAFGVAESTGQGKAKLIRQMLKVHQFDHRWILPSRWESNTMIWTVTDPSGFLVDIRQQSVAMQRAAFRQGLIPYVPADRAAAALREQIAASPARHLFQFKITLRGTEPPVWRRIQVLDDTLDKLHEHIQTAMGWTNSHLHHFFIRGQRYGDPELIQEDFEPSDALDSTKTLLGAVLPADGAPLSFEYEYDFGDGWMHDVLFEGSLPEQPGVLYPQCLEGARACPPEDVGGIDGYADYLEAITDPSHKRHQELRNWSGPFNPATFSARLATHVMQEGMPDSRQRD